MLSCSHPGSRLIRNYLSTGIGKGKTFDESRIKNGGQPMSMSAGKQESSMRLIALIVSVGALAGCTSLNPSQTKAPLTKFDSSKVIADYDETDPFGQVSIPVEVADDGEIFVKAVINESVSVRFQIEVGAKSVTLSPAVLDRLSGQVFPSDSRIRPCWTHSEKKIADGLIETTTQCLLDQLSVGPLVFENVRAGHVTGDDLNVLGTAFLAELGDFKLDIPNGLLIARVSDTYRLVPRASFFETRDQEIFAAMQHWDTLAGMEVTRMLQSLEGDQRPVWIKSQPPDASPFGDAYTHLLTKHLVQNGKQVVIDPSSVDDALEIQHQISVVEHRNAEKEAFITTRVLDGAVVVFSNSNIFYVAASDSGAYIGPQLGFLVNFPVTGCENQEGCS